MRLELVLTDGRTSSGDAMIFTRILLYSPYACNAVIKCIPASPKAGTYNIAMQDSYGDGWNGGFINVVINGTALAPIAIASGSSGTGLS